MDPITLALGLAQFAPSIMRFFGVGEKAAAVADTVVKIAQGVTGAKSGPEALEALRANADLAQAFNLAVLAADAELRRAQIGVNLEEAKSLNVFVAGWRPFVGWACGAALVYVAIIEPVARFFAQVMFGYAGAFPAIDTTLTMQVLLGMLGLATMRSVEKVKNAEGNR